MSFQAPDSDAEPFKAPEDDADPPKWSDLPGNILPDAKAIGTNAAQTGLRIGKGIYDLPSDLTETARQELTGGSPFETPLAEDLKTVGSGVVGAVKAIPGQLKDLISKDAWIQHPVGNAMTAGAIAAPFLAPEAEAGEAAARGMIKPPARIGGLPEVPPEVPPVVPKAAAPLPADLPVMEPGSKAGDPHALFSYNDDFGPGGTKRSIYNVFGDPEHPAVKGVGHGSSITKADLDKAGIPVTGREPRSVGKWEPLDLGEKEPALEPVAGKGAPGVLPSAPEVAPVSTKGSIGSRMAARTTAQALDINPMALRKQAMKAGVTPEDYVLDLGDQAHKLIPNLIEPMDTANTKFGKIIEAHDDAGQQIGQLVKSMTRGTKGSFPEGQEAINELRAAAKDYDQVDGGDLALAKTADRLESLQKDGKLDFDRLSKYKSNIGKGFNKTDSPAGTEDIYGILSDNAQKVVDRLTVEDPTLAPELTHLKQVYTVTSRLIPAMARSAAKEVAGGSVGGGFVSKLLPSAVGGAIGGPGGAALGAGAKYLQETIAPDLGKNLSYMTMKAAPKMIAAVQKMFPKLSQAAAAQLAVRMAKGDQSNGMYQGGRVPDEVRKYVGC